MGHQHEAGSIHDEGKGHSPKGENVEHAGGKDIEAGGGRDEHRSSGSHDTKITGTHRRRGDSHGGGVKENREGIVHK